MNVTIRPMTITDCPILAEWMVEIPLWQRYGVTFERARSNFENGLTNGDWMFSVDTAEMAACGFAQVAPKGMCGISPYLRLIGVHSSAQSIGLGSALLAAIESRAAENSNDLFLLSSDFNESAHRFYKRHGYEQIGAIPDYVVPSITEFIFRKRLR
jgi:ribosomal protein S18 acetylase RimI-like enzyme